jgi:ATP adenylyltransferase
MDALWAPWRMEFILGDKPPGCIFCLFPAEAGAEADRKNLILGRTQRSFAILNKFPYNNGHLMVVPRRHTADFASLDTAEIDDLHALLRLSVELVGQAYTPEGINVGMNLGRCAGAGIVDHLHYHVVPRWNGDTNFMPVLAGTKVMVEHLNESHRKMRGLFDARLA